MDLLDKIFEAGIVGCGGAGFPSHLKLNTNVEHLIVNGAECEPLLRTDRFLMKHKAMEIVEATVLSARLVSAKQMSIALKESYTEEIEALESAARENGNGVLIHRLHNYYPAGDEQMVVLDVTGRPVPPSGIPKMVDAVVSNVATIYAIYEAEKGIPFTTKYFTITGEVVHPMIMHGPIGISVKECVERAVPSLTSWHFIVGGPLMGQVYSMEEAESVPITKTTSGIIIVEDEHPLVRKKAISLSSMLMRGKSACIQCRLCTDLCPRFLSGHSLQPHKIMRKMAYQSELSEVLHDDDVKQALICCECGICEIYACPMNLQPARVNQFLKAELKKAGIVYPSSMEKPVPRDMRVYRQITAERMAARVGMRRYYDRSIEELVEIDSDQVSIPLKQHIGTPARAIVGVGDRVQIGQMIGEVTREETGAKIHASISGVVREVGICVKIERQ